MDSTSKKMNTEKMANTPGVKKKDTSKYFADAIK